MVLLIWPADAFELISIGKKICMDRRSFLGTIGSIAAITQTASAADAGSQKSARQSSTSSGRKVGIALGGGSMHGIAHIGVVRALTERGLQFDFIAGTSAGAVVGALTAAQLPNDEIEQIVRGIEWPGLMNFAWSGKGLLRNPKLQTTIDAALGGRRLEQLAIPFGAIATDVVNGERVIIREGSAGAAIGASCSIPVIFEPIKIDGRDLVDGCLTEPVPVIAVREMGADIVIGVDVAYRPNEERFYGLTGVAFQTMHIMGNALINEHIRQADVAIRMNLHQYIGMDNSHEQLIAAGYAAAIRAWPKLATALL